MSDVVGFAFSLLSLAIVIAIVMCGAYPVVHSRRDALKRLFGSADWMREELISASVVLTILYLAFVGLVLCIAPWSIRRVLAEIALVVPIGVGWFVWRSRNQEQKESPGSFFFFFGAAIFSAASLFIGHLDVVLPEKLPDGAYVNKEHVMAVRIQKLTGNLPADNVVPFVVEEYMARRISFRENAPILPGQQVTNRPILVSLVALPLRLALRPVQRMESLPRFSYVDTMWPDFRVLVRDGRAFSVFLGVGVFLNSCLLMAVGILVARYISDKSKAWLVILLFCTSPYFLFQTLFTWPKALAGFLILLAFLICRGRARVGVLTSGALLGMAYLSHPYAIGYFLVALFFLAALNRDAMMVRVRNVILICSSFALLLLPWWYWSTVVLRLDSDLVSQNFLVKDFELYPFIWMRIANVASAVMPMYLSVGGASFADSFVRSSMCVTGALGLLFVASVFLNGWRRPSVSLTAVERDLNQTNASGMQWLFWPCAAAAVLLACVFSAPAVPVLHGWQPLIALVLVWGIGATDPRNRLATYLLELQVVINVVQLGFYFDIHIL